MTLKSSKLYAKLALFFIILSACFTIIIQTGYAAQNTPPAASAPAVRLPSANTPQGPQPEGDSAAAPSSEVKKWSKTKWTVFAMALFSVILILILGLIYKKQKEIYPDAKKTKLLKGFLLIYPPVAYLAILVVSLLGGKYYQAINPIMINLKLLGLQIRVAYYGVIYASGFVIAYIWMRFARNNNSLDMSIEELDTFFIFACVGVVLGARVFEAIFYVSPWYNFFWWREGFTSWQNGFKFLKVWEGGLSAHGGMVGAIVATLWFCKKKGKSFYSIMDTIVLPASLALAVGRFANYINSEILGIPTGGDWGVIFKNAAQPGQLNVARIPTQLFESWKNLAIFAILMLVRKRLKKPGMVAWLWALLYGSFRFIIEFFKSYEPLFDLGAFNFTMGHVLCLAMIGASSFVLFMMVKGGDLLTTLPAAPSKKKKRKKKK